MVLTEMTVAVTRARVRRWMLTEGSVRATALVAEAGKLRGRRRQ